MAGGGFGGGGGLGKSSSEKPMKKTNQMKEEMTKAVSKKLSLKNMKNMDEIIEKYCPGLDINYSGIRVIHEDPLIIEVDNFFSESACDKYIQLAQDEGAMYGSQTFSNGAGSTRSSTTWYIPYGIVPEFLNNLSKLLGKSIYTFEEPQVVRYELGQQFTWHYDAMPGTMIGLAGQRVATLIVYLNTVGNGGATVFKDLGIQVKPVKGKALIFFPCDNEGNADDRTMHAGQVAMDTKWIAQTWVRQKEYNPTVPTIGSQKEGEDAVEHWLSNA